MGGVTSTAVTPESRPLLLAVEADPAMLGRIEGELQRGFGSDYRVRGEVTVAEALQVLERAHAQDDRVALVLVDHTIAAEERTELMSRLRVLHR